MGQSTINLGMFRACGLTEAKSFSGALGLLWWPSMAPSKRDGDPQCQREPVDDGIGPNASLGFSEKGSELRLGARFQCSTV